MPKCLSRSKNRAKAKKICLVTLLLAKLCGILDDGFDLPILMEGMGGNEDRRLGKIFGIKFERSRESSKMFVFVLWKRSKLITERMPKG